MVGEPPIANTPIMLDGLPLKIRLERAERMRKVRAIALILPLLVFLLVTFAIPIAAVLLRSFENPELGKVLPQTSARMLAWDGESFPPNETLQTFVREVVSAKQDKTVGKAAKRLNYQIAGFRSLMFKTATRLERAVENEGADAVFADPRMLERLKGLDPRWGERHYWKVLRQAAPPHTAWFLLQAVDRDYDVNDEIVREPDDEAIHVTVLGRTLWISVMVTLLCLVFGYPVAYLLATVPTRQSNVLILLLLLPFWTSLLVRTTAWLVLLQDQGLVNDLGIWLGAWDEPLELIRNRMGVYIAMVHILLPFMVLPMFSVMKGIDASHMKAAASLGARPIPAFVKVYLPQTLPGVGAGVLLVFILTLGFYITPVLVGGPKEQMLSSFIVYHMNRTVNWGLAASLSVVLMVCVAIFFAIYQRLIGVDQIRTS